jgi:phospholipid/cholesterol/gamma-HCH transport system ATP-binding protein
MNREPIVQVKNLVASYGDRTVLKGVNLDIYPGESLAILGRSGCGKSTLLRHMIGLLKPQSGQVIIKGKDINAISEDEKNELFKKIGMLFQSSALFNSMTIGDNVAFPLREHTDLKESTIQIMMKMKLDLVGLSGFDQFKPAQLSGGMKKRAGLARAIAMDPEVIFCDEPSAGLDPVVAAGLDNLIIKLKKAFKMTIVVVTHEMESVFTMADRIAMMHEGKILAIGTKEELQNHSDPVIQRFLKRIPDDEEIDREAYLKTIMGE